MTTSEIPEKAIEAAARADYLAPIPGLELTNDPNWELLGEHEKQQWRDGVLPQVQAAAPYLKAQALREYADELYRDTPSRGPERVRRYLRVQGLRLRADNLEAQA